MDPFSHDDDGGGTIFRDVILLALASFVVIAFLLLPHINPPNIETNKEVDAPGQVIVEIQWQYGVDADVDLWVRAPGDQAVGYSNKGSTFFNLLRDDLGAKSDTTQINYEISASRGIPDGEYVVNLHMYNNRALVWPILVDVSIKRERDNRVKTFFETRVPLVKQGEEVTVVRFKLLREELDESSINFIPIKLRSMRFR